MLCACGEVTQTNLSFWFGMTGNLTQDLPHSRRARLPNDVGFKAIVTSYITYKPCFTNVMLFTTTHKIIPVLISRREQM